MAGLACDDVAAEMTAEWQVAFVDKVGDLFPVTADANGVTSCSSGVSYISYDQAMTLESEWYEGEPIRLMFLR